MGKHILDVLEVMSERCPEEDERIHQWKDAEDGTASQEAWRKTIEEE